MPGLQVSAQKADQGRKSSVTRRRAGGSMAEQQRLNLLRNFYDALNRDDMETMLGLCDEEVEVYQSPEVVAAVPPRGHKDVESYLRGWLESWHAYSPEPEE